MKKLAHLALAALMMASFPVATLAIEPANPVKGAERRIYNIAPKGDGATHKGNFSSMASAIKAGRETAYSTSVDEGDVFLTESNNGYHPDMGMWTGFLKRKEGGEYTIVFTTNGGNKFPMYSLWINNRQIMDAETETTAVTVPLTAGFNEVCIIVEGTAKYHISISIKRKDSLKEPSIISPSSLWHEDEPDDEDED